MCESYIILIKKCIFTIRVTCFWEAVDTRKPLFSGIHLQIEITLSTTTLRILLGILITFMVISCSRKKDKFINRNWHSLTTKNNTLYNGRIAYEEGKSEVINTYDDNFWKLLPIERLEIRDEIIYGNVAQNKNFERSEEKAGKSIQRHSMNIQGRERNPKIAKSFLLLGKSRYYDQRFIPAIEAFNYILYKYPTSTVINHAKVWRAKTNMRLDNNELAIQNLEKLLQHELEDMKDQDYADIAATLAQAYSNLGVRDTALAYIKHAATHTKIKEEESRYLYIKGQLYNSLEQKDSANLAFDEVIARNRRAPRKYMINAYMEKARNFDYETEDRIAFLELLNELEENYENKKFLDKIYHQKAVYFKTLDSLDLAEVFYNKSLRTVSGDDYLKSLNYETLAEMSFDASQYAKSGAYLDSTLQRIVVDSKRHRTLKKKRDNLDDVILYEGIATVNDSILTVTAMTPEAQLAYYQKYTDSLKVVAIALAEKEKIAAAKATLPTAQGFDANIVKAAGSNTTAGIFYFYNPTAVSKGKISFRKTFGERTSEDDWRLSDKSSANFDSDEEVQLTTNDSIVEAYSIATDPNFDPQTYIAQLPTAPKVLDSLAKARNFAYYQLGVIYKEKFKEYTRATDKFEALLQNSPEERLILPSKYNLYKIYTLMGEASKAEYYKNDIITKHSDSRYAAIVKNPNQELKADQTSPEVLFEKLYTDFNAGNYAKVMEFSERYINRFTGMDIVPKFELLKAQTIARLEGTEAYKKALNYIALTYPQNPEGKKAQEMYDELIPKFESATFTDDPREEARKFKLMYAFPINDSTGAAALQKKIDDVIKELRYGDFKTSIDNYDGQQQFVVLHSRRNKQGTIGFGELLSTGKVEDTRDKPKRLALAKKRKRRFRKRYYPAVEMPYTGITSTNYRTLLLKKNLEEYLAYSTPQEEPQEPAEKETQSKEKL